MSSVQLEVQSRDVQGRSASRRLRRDGATPGIIYGTSEAKLISLNHNAIYHALKREDFHTSILNLNVDGKIEKVLLRDYQMHPFRQQVLHIDFQRVSEKEEVQMRIPLHFINEDICVAVKTQGAHITHVITDVEIRALPKNLPQYIEVDLKDITAGVTLHLSNIVLPEGVSLVNLLRGEDSVVATVATIVEQVEAPVEVVAAADIPTVGGAKEGPQE
jgi:large subunit ribosomal protein L25